MISLFTLIKDRIQGKAPKGARRRSPYWRTIRKEFLKEFPFCAVCGRNTKLEVHHKLPYYMAPDLELEPSNLVTLCENKKNGISCHLLGGHSGDFRSVNLNVDQTVIILKTLIDEGRKQIKAHAQMDKK